MHHMHTVFHILISKALFFLFAPFLAPPTPNARDASRRVDYPSSPPPSIWRAMACAPFPRPTLPRNITRGPAWPRRAPGPAPRGDSGAQDAAVTIRTASCVSLLTRITSGFPAKSFASGGGGDDGRAGCRDVHGVRRPPRREHRCGGAVCTAELVADSQRHMYICENFRRK